MARKKKTVTPVIMGIRPQGKKKEETPYPTLPSDSREDGYEVVSRLDIRKSRIRFIKGRLKFGDSRQSAPFPSMVVVYK